MDYTSSPQNQKMSDFERKDKDREYCRRVMTRHEQMVSERTNWETHWQECMTYIIPRKDEIIIKRQDGEKRGNQLYDTTAITANLMLAGALHSMLTSSTQRFFDLTFNDPELDNVDEVREWLQENSERMFRLMNRTNFQTEIHEIYLDLGAIGTACLYMGEDKDSVVHFSARSMKEIYVAENNLGVIDIVHRCFKWTPRQIVMEFGEENTPECVMKCYHSGSEQKFEIMHVVCPSTEKNSMWKFESCYMLKEEQIILSKKGFKEFPFAVPRWTKTSGETYGRGPGMDMLPDIKMAGAMMETIIKGAQKTVDPPMMVTDDGVIGRVRLTPGGLTVVRASNETPIRPLITDARIDFGQAMVEDVRARIRTGFYVDQLQLRESDRMTATEVTTRNEERLRLMGPILGRQEFEFLRVVIERVFGIMLRRGMISTPPQQIQGRQLDVRYTSLVAKVQRMQDGVNLQRAMATAAPLAQIYPEVTDNLDPDVSFRYVMDTYGVPQKLLRKLQNIQELREQRAASKQQAEQAAIQAHQAELVQKAGPTLVQAQELEQARQEG